MPLARSDIDAALTSKGFRKDERGDHDRYWLFVGEMKQSIYTKISRGTNYRTVGDDLVSKIARQVRLTRGQLYEFVACSISGSQYIDCLKAQNIELTQPTPPPKTARGTTRPARKK